MSKVPCFYFWLVLLCPRGTYSSTSICSDICVDSPSWLLWFLLWCAQGCRCLDIACGYIPTNGITGPMKVLVFADVIYNGCTRLHGDSLSLFSPALIIFLKSQYITFDIICFVVTLGNQFSVLYGKSILLWLFLIQGIKVLEGWAKCLLIE